MTHHLRSQELCPLHHSYTCACHPGDARFLRRFQVAVEIVEDEHHPRGFRELCSQRELRRRKHILIERGEGCFYCKEGFTDYEEIDLAHKQPKGMGGATRDDHWENLALAHRRCNSENGSKHAEE